MATTGYERMMKLRNRLAAQGLCIYNCGDPAPPGRRCCKRCIRILSMKKVWRKEREAAAS